MLKRVLHTANQVVTHEETHTGTRELTIENTVNDSVDMLTVTGDSWQLVQEEIKDEEGNVTQPAMPSTEYPSEIVSVNGEMASCGWNLLDCSKIVNLGTSNNSPTEYTFQNGVCIGRKSDGTFNQMILYFPNIYLEAGKTYVFLYSKAYYTVKSTGNKYKNGTTAGDVNMELSLNGKMVFREYARTEKSFTPSITGKYVFAMVAFFNILSLTEFEVYNLTVKEITNKSKPYDHYRGNSIILPTLRSLPDGTKDVLYVDRKNQRAWVERKIGETVLDGSERTWKIYYENEGKHVYEVEINNALRNWGSLNVYCSHFKSEFGRNMYVGDYTGSACSILQNTRCLFGSTDRTGIFESIDTFKAFLSEHPVTVQYRLIDPIIEELPYSDYLLETAQYQTNIRMTGLNENLQPEITAQCKILGR